MFAINRLLAFQWASQRRQAMTEEVREALHEMHARYGTAHTADFWGWSAVRDEELFWVAESARQEGCPRPKSRCAAARQPPSFFTAG